MQVPLEYLASDYAVDPIPLFERNVAGILDDHPAVRIDPELEIF